MKTEREMLVLAAKAIGMKIDPIDAEHDPKDWEAWNPLADDEDALQLAAKLKIDLEWQHDDDAVEAYARALKGWAYCPSYPSSEYRRAIVDVAAHIGESMP